MKYKTKLFKAFLLLGTLFLFNCQPEQEVSYQEETTSRKLNIWKYPAERIFKETKVVKEKISTLKQKNNEARLTSSLYDFSIEESEVQVIYEATYTQYSFLIYRSIPVSNVLENYICKVYNDGYVEQFLVAYPFSEDENGMVYHAPNATMQIIQDDSIINTARGIPAGCVPEFVDTVWTYECVNVACSGPHSGSHTEPSDCLCGTPEHKYCTPPHTECDWISVNTWTISCPNNGGPGDTTGNGDTGLTGGGSTGTGSTTEDEIITVPVTINLTEQKFIQSLNPDEFSCYSLNTTPENKNQIINYLNANKTDNVINPEAIAFAKLASQSICDGGEVDFDNEIINRLEGKALCIYNKLQNLSIGFNNAINKFDSQFSIAHLQFKLDNTGETLAVYENGVIVSYDRANTSFPDANNLITITLNNVLPSSINNNSVNQQPNLLVAQTIIHEIIHAEFFRQIIEVVNQGSLVGVTNQDVLNALENSNYDLLYEYFRRYKNWSHTYMAAHYRDVIARVTQEFMTGIAVLDSQQPEQLYLDLAWRGLMNNEVWENLPSSQKSQIKNTIDNYLINNSNQICTD